MTEKKYTVEELRNMDYKVVREEEPAEFEDEFGNTLNIDEMIEQADKDLEEKQQANLNLRWNKKQINRLKRVAEARGQKYQTFIKSILDQVIDSEEKKLGLG